MIFVTLTWNKWFPIWLRSILSFCTEIKDSLFDQNPTFHLFSISSSSLWYLPFRLWPKNVLFAFLILLLVESLNSSHTSEAANMKFMISYSWVFPGRVPHSQNKKCFRAYLIWCFSLSQIGDLCQYLEGPISISRWHNKSRVTQLPLT